MAEIEYALESPTLKENYDAREGYVHCLHISTEDSGVIKRLVGLAEREQIDFKSDGGVITDMYGTYYFHTLKFKKYSDVIFVRLG